MRATLGLLIGMAALAVSAGAQAQALDSRAALFNAAFANHHPLAAGHSQIAPLNAVAT
jgi:hypothetical protein